MIDRNGRRDRDGGAASVELALVLLVLLLVLALGAPLIFLAYNRVQLGRTAGDVIRYASSRSDAPRDGGAVLANDQPTPALVRAEAARAWTGTGTAPTLTFGSGSTTTTGYRLPHTVDPGCPSGFRQTVVLSTDVPLGPFVDLLAVAGIPLPNPRTLTATATSCEE